MGAVVSLQSRLAPEDWERAVRTAAQVEAFERARDEARRRQRAEWTRQAEQRIARNPSPVQPELF